MRSRFKTNCVNRITKLKSKKDKQPTLKVMQLLDTQVISYAFKGAYDGQINQQLISSITAKEFLLIQGSDRTSANYYVPYCLANKRRFYHYRFWSKKSK